MTVFIKPERGFTFKFGLKFLFIFQIIFNGLVFVSQSLAEKWYKLHMSFCAMTTAIATYVTIHSGEKSYLQNI